MMLKKIIASLVFPGERMKKLRGSNKEVLIYKNHCLVIEANGPGTIVRLPERRVRKALEVLLKERKKGWILGSAIWVLDGGKVVMGKLTFTRNEVKQIVKFFDN
jgi:hypothetical protein